MVIKGGGGKREEQMPQELQLNVDSLYRDRKEFAS